MTVDISDCVFVFSILCLFSFELSWLLATTPSHLILHPRNLGAMDCLNCNFIQAALGFIQCS